MSSKGREKLVLAASQLLDADGCRLSRPVTPNVADGSGMVCVLCHCTTLRRAFPATFGTLPHVRVVFELPAGSDTGVACFGAR
jgi:hypothetical protein